MDITIAFMISIEECKKYINDKNLTDKQIEELRDSLYILIERLLNNYIRRETDTIK